MSRESSYMAIESPLNIGLTYRFNDYLNFSTQYLHGNQLSVTAQVITNPGRPPLIGGKDLAPVPMRLRGEGSLPLKLSNEAVIEKVLGRSFSNSL